MFGLSKTTQERYSLITDGEKYAIKNRRGKLLYFTTHVTPFWIDAADLSESCWVEKEKAETAYKRLIAAEAK